MKNETPITEIQQPPLFTRPMRAFQALVEEDYTAFGNPGDPINNHCTPGTWIDDVTIYRFRQGQRDEYPNPQDTELGKKLTRRFYAEAILDGHTPAIYASLQEVFDYGTNLSERGSINTHGFTSTIASQFGINDQSFRSILRASRALSSIYGNLAPDLFSEPFKQMISKLAWDTGAVKNRKWTAFFEQVITHLPKDFLPSDFYRTVYSLNTARTNMAVLPLYESSFFQQMYSQLSLLEFSGDPLLSLEAEKQLDIVSPETYKWALKGLTFESGVPMTPRAFNRGSNVLESYFTLAIGAEIRALNLNNTSNSFY